MENILSKALSILPQQGFQWVKFNGRTTNDIGIDVPSYDNAVDLSGSVQSVDRSLYQKMGLDWKRIYIIIYSLTDIIGIERDSSGDKVIYAGKTFQVLSENDWIPMNDWSGVLCVEIPQ